MGGRGAAGYRATAFAALLRLGLLLALGCTSAKSKEPSGPPEVKVGAENLARAERAELQSGPTISGNLQPRRVAMVRAQVGGQVMAVEALQGDQVPRDKVLARIDDSALREQERSAQLAVASATAARRVAELELARSRKLAKGGGITERDLERTRAALTAASAQLAEAQARLIAARQQLDRTVVRAPFDGVISERQVSMGDYVAPGGPMFAVIDLGSLRLEAAVPAQNLQELKEKTAVDFTVAGFANRRFRGEITRINPAVDPSTGQVRVYVDIPNEAGPLISGLFAQGRVETLTAKGLVLPADAVDLSTTPPSALRVENGRVQRVPLQLGMRDEVANRVEVRSGLQPGDTVLRGSVRGALAEGTRVRAMRAPGEAPEEEGQALGGSGQANHRPDAGSEGSDDAGEELEGEDGGEDAGDELPMEDSGPLAPEGNGDRPRRQPRPQSLTPRDEVEPFDGPQPPSHGPFDELEVAPAGEVPGPAVDDPPPAKVPERRAPEPPADGRRYTRPPEPLR